MRRRWQSTALVLAFAFMASAARAEPRALDTISEPDKALARGLVATGDERFTAGDHAGALAAYRSAHTIMGVPTTGIEVARTLAVMGKVDEALEVTDAVLGYPRMDDEPAAFSRARGQAALLASELRNAAPSEAAPRGEAPMPDEVDVPSTARHMAPAFWVGVAVTASGLVVGSLHGVVALTLLDDIDERCTEDQICELSERDDFETARVFAHASTVAFGVAGAGAVLTLVGLLLPSSAAEGEAGVRPLVGPGVAGLSGRF